MTIGLIVELLLAMVRILCVWEDISAGIGEDSNNITVINLHYCQGDRYGNDA